MTARRLRPGPCGIAIAAALVLVALALAPSADAGDGTWVQTIVPDLTAPFGIDLSLSGNPFASSVRIPLSRPGDSASGLTPYVSAGATDPTRTFDSTPGLLGRDVDASRNSQRLDIGAGLNWYFSDRLQLFGEMGFQRAREQASSPFGLEGNRDGTYFKGGVTIRVP